MVESWSQWPARTSWLQLQLQKMFLTFWTVIFQVIDSSDIVLQVGFTSFILFLNKKGYTVVSFKKCEAWVNLLSLGKLGIPKSRLKENFFLQGLELRFRLYWGFGSLDFLFNLSISGLKFKLFSVLNFQKVENWLRAQNL